MPSQSRGRHVASPSAAPSRAGGRADAQWDAHWDPPAFRRWLVGFAAVRFDLEQGQLVEALFPAGALSAEEEADVAFSSFPDSMSAVHSRASLYDCLFFFRIRRRGVPPALAATSAGGAGGVDNGAGGSGDGAAEGAGRSALAAQSPLLQRQHAHASVGRGAAGGAAARATSRAERSAASSRRQSASPPRWDPGTNRATTPGTTPRRGISVGYGGGPGGAMAESISAPASSLTSPTGLAAAASPFARLDRCATEPLAGGEAGDEAEVQWRAQAQAGALRHSASARGSAGEREEEAAVGRSASMGAGRRAMPAHSQDDDDRGGHGGSGGAAAAGGAGRGGARYVYGFVFNRQRHDARLPRGGEQKSVVVLSERPFSAAFRRLAQVVGPLYFDRGPIAFVQVAAWVSLWPAPYQPSVAGGGGVGGAAGAGGVMELAVGPRTSLRVQLPPAHTLPPASHSALDDFTAAMAPAPLSTSAPQAQHHGQHSIARIPPHTHHFTSPPRTRHRTPSTHHPPHPAVHPPSLPPHGPPRLHDIFHHPSPSTLPSCSPLLPLFFLPLLDPRPHSPSPLPPTIAPPFHVIYLPPKSPVAPAPSPLPQGIFHDADVFGVLRGVAAQLWVLWELLLLGEPLLVIAPTPAQCSEAVAALVGLIAPLPCSVDFRPYFTIHDPDFPALNALRDGDPLPAVLLGVTNLFFLKALKHLPHVLSVGRPPHGGQGVAGAARYGVGAGGSLQPNGQVALRDSAGRLPHQHQSPLRRLATGGLLSMLAAGSKGLARMRGEGPLSLMGEHREALWTNHVPAVKPDTAVLNRLLDASTTLHPSASSRSHRSGSAVTNAAASAAPADATSLASSAAAAAAGAAAGGGAGGRPASASAPPSTASSLFSLPGAVAGSLLAGVTGMPALDDAADGGSGGAAGGVGGRGAAGVSGETVAMVNNEAWRRAGESPAVSKLRGDLRVLWAHMPPASQRLLLLSPAHAASLHLPPSAAPHDAARGSLAVSGSGESGEGRWGQRASEGAGTGREGASGGGAAQGAAAAAGGRGGGWAGWLFGRRNVESTGSGSGAGERQVTASSDARGGEEAAEAGRGGPAETPGAAVPGSASAGVDQGVASGDLSGDSSGVVGSSGEQSGTVEMVEAAQHLSALVANLSLPPVIALNGESHPSSNPGKAWSEASSPPRGSSAGLGRTSSGASPRTAGIGWGTDMWDGSSGSLTSSSARSSTPAHRATTTPSSSAMGSSTGHVASARFAVSPVVPFGRRPGLSVGRTPPRLSSSAPGTPLHPAPGGAFLHARPTPAQATAPHQGARHTAGGDARGLSGERLSACASAREEVGGGGMGEMEGGGEGGGVRVARTATEPVLPSSFHSLA
ncbi:unnamed protein product [Closterium sp. Yama58-4]|nr:unnamed protein product [Closterium sp. Yama58-4]